ncbi:MAG: hypothetical protein WBM17_03410 [Anaerolineales bacterium]
MNLSNIGEVAMISFNRIPLLICLGSFMLLSGCQPAATPVPTGTPTETPTLTTTPTLTETPTITPTNTETFTATPTFTNTPPYNVAGTYYIYKCASYALEGAPITVSFCVNTVNVREDFTMQFNVSWKVNGSGYRVTKYSDADNPDMFLEDNLGNRYKHSGTGGCAAETAVFQGAGTCAGWFIFPAAKPGVTSFRFYDMDNNIYVDDIVLLDKKYIPTATMTLSPTHGTTYNAPGKYFIYRCGTYIPGGRLSGAQKVQLCLTTVVINDDFTLKFNLTWEVFTSVSGIKDSDANNNNIILLDNLENEYRHTQTGGCAAKDASFGSSGGKCSGWFLFPPAKPGVTSFRYVDLGNLISFDNLVFMIET